MAGFGGACIRFAAEESTSIDALESGFWKTISYSFLWWWLAVRNCQDEDYVFFSGEITDDEDRSIFQNMNKCESYSGSVQVRVVFVLSHTIWIILTTIGVVSGHPLVWLCKKILLGRVMTFPAYFFHLGPGDNDNKDDNDDSDSDDAFFSGRTIVQGKQLAYSLTDEGTGGAIHTVSRPPGRPTGSTTKRRKELVATRVSSRKKSKSRGDITITTKNTAPTQKTNKVSMLNHFHTNGFGTVWAFRRLDRREYNCTSNSKN